MANFCITVLRLVIKACRAFRMGALLARFSRENDKLYQRSKPISIFMLHFLKTKQNKQKTMLYALWLQ